MSDWKELPLNDVIELVIDHRGKTPKKLGFDDFFSEGYPVLSAKHVKTSGLVNLDAMRFANEEMYKKWMKEPTQKGDVILTSEAPLGELFYIDGSKKYVLGQRVFGLRPKSDVLDSMYLLVWLSSAEGQGRLQARATGSTVQGIKQSELLKIMIPIPPMEVQKDIASIYGSLDQKIQLNTQINQTLEQIAQSLFKSWFVDFDPVRAKAQALSDGLNLEQAELAAMQAISGKTPEELTALSQAEPDRYAELAETANAFPCEMVEVDGVEVPKGWEVKPFGSLLENTIGGDWGKEEEDEKHTENVFVFRGTDLPNVQKNEFDAIPKRYIAKNKLKSRKAKYGDIIIEVSGGSKNQPTGRSLLITKNLLCNFDLPIIPASFCRLFTPINEQIAVLLACHLKMIYTQGKTWEYQVQSTGISNFQTTNFLENELLVIPDENILNAFYEKVGVIFEKMTSNENMLLSKTRDLLLPRLLNEEI